MDPSDTKISGHTCSSHEHESEPDSRSSQCKTWSTDASTGSTMLEEGEIDTSETSIPMEGCPRSQCPKLEGNHIHTNRFPAIQELGTLDLHSKRKASSDLQRPPASSVIPRPVKQRSRKRLAKPLYQPWKADRAQAQAQAQADTETSHPKHAQITLPIADTTPQTQTNAIPKPTPEAQEALSASLARLRLPLAPLISVTTGLSHPNFPQSLLQYHLLTHETADSLAAWYHQADNAGSARWVYPCPMQKTWVQYNDKPGSFDTVSDIDLCTKRRRVGRFIGLRGCQSPTSTGPLYLGSSSGANDNEAGPSRQGSSTGEDVVMREGESAAEKEENPAERMQREWLAALRKAEDEKARQEKFWRGHQ